MTHAHSFPADEDIDDHICDGDEVEQIQYIGQTEVVTCSSADEDTYTKAELEAMARHEVYHVAEEVGSDVDWYGEDADTKEMMIMKILEAQEG